MFVFLLTAPLPGSHRGKQMKFYTFRRSDEFQTLSSPLDFDFFQFEPPRKVINCLYNVRFPPSQRADCFRLFRSRTAGHHIIIKYQYRYQLRFIAGFTNSLTLQPTYLSCFLVMMGLTRLWTAWWRPRLCWLCWLDSTSSKYKTSSTSYSRSFCCTAEFPAVFSCFSNVTKSWQLFDFNSSRDHHTGVTKHKTNYSRGEVLPSCFGSRSMTHDSLRLQQPSTVRFETSKNLRFRHHDTRQRMHLVLTSLPLRRKSNSTKLAIMSTWDLKHHHYYHRIHGNRIMQTYMNGWFW